MSILGRAFGFEERAGATSNLKNPASWLIQAVTGGQTSPSGVNVSGSSAMGNSAVYACVRALSDASASIPLRSYKHGANGREVLQPLPSTTAGLLEQPMPGLPQANFVSNAIVNLNAYGNAFWAKIESSTPGGTPFMLLPVRPSRVSIKLVDGEPIYNVVPGDGSSWSGSGLTRRDILHVKGMTLDGIVGLSPITAARTAIGLGMALEEFASRYFANSATPGGLIKTAAGKTLSPEAAQRLKADFESMHRGLRNSSRVGILEDGMTWEAITGSMLDAQFLEQRKLSATEIARIFRVPPWVIAADSGSSMTYSNVEQQVSGFLTFAVRPWLVFIQQGLAADPDLYPEDRSVWPEFDMDVLLKADAQTRAAVNSLGLGAHGGKPWLTVNDVRASENLPRVDGGDEIGPSVHITESTPTAPVPTK